MPRECRYRDLVGLAARLPPGCLEEDERLLVDMLAEGLGPGAVAERLGLSRVSVYRRLESLKWKIFARLPASPVADRAFERACVSGCRPDPVRHALESDPGRVRMAADMGLRRPFSELAYCHKQVAGVNALSWQARRWLERDRARRRAYLTEVGYGSEEEPRGLAVDPECRLLCRDLLDLARVRFRVRLDSGLEPPPFPEGRDGAAAWLATGDPRGPRSVRWLLDAVEERVLSVVPSPERVGRVRVPGRGGRRRLLDLYVVHDLWVAVRWRAPWPGADREAWEVWLAQAIPVGCASFRDLLDEEHRVVGFISGGSEPVRKAVLAPLWGESGFECDLPAQLYWRRSGEPWFALPGDFLGVGDRVRPLLGQDAWVLLARGIKVRRLSPVAVARWTGHKVGRECLLATRAGAARLTGRGGAGDESADCDFWRYWPARRVVDRVTGKVREEPARLERMWLD